MLAANISRLARLEGLLQVDITEGGEMTRENTERILKRENGKWGGRWFSHGHEYSGGKI